MHFFLAAKPLPHPIAYAAVVPFGDSFLLVGGWTKGCLSLSTIYYYNIDEEDWTPLDSILNERKCNVVAMMVDRKMFYAD